MSAIQGWDFLLLIQNEIESNPTIITWLLTEGAVTNLHACLFGFYIFAFHSTVDPFNLASLILSWTSFGVPLLASVDLT